MAITVNFRSLGETATYDDGVTEQDIHDDFQRRQYRKNFATNPITAIMGLAEHVTSQPTAPTPASVSGSSVIGLAPDQTTALLDRVQRTNEVNQQAYQAQVERAARAKETQAAREFAMSQQGQQQQFQVQQQEAENARQDAKDKQNKLEGTVKQDPKTGDWIWTRPDPNTGEPVISVSKAGSNTWEKITGPDGSIMQVQVDPTGKMLGQPQTIIQGDGDKVNWQQVGSPYQTADGRYVQNVINPSTRQVETMELPKPAQNSQRRQVITDEQGRPHYVENNQLVPFTLPPGFSTKEIENSGIKPADLNREINNVVNQELGGMMDPAEFPAVVQRAMERLRTVQSGTANMNAPLGTPPGAATTSNIIKAPNGQLVEIID